MNMERRIVAVNRVNSAFAAWIIDELQHTCTFGRTQYSVGTDAVIWQRNENERKMKAVEMRSLRRICEVSIADRILNEKIKTEW